MSPIFVVQRHEATALHYDLRLQVGDVLASWAVPKGPSLDPRVKRLAKQVEDHELGHATFEGQAGRHRGGPGTVIVWDTGELTNLTERDGEPVELADAVARRAPQGRAARSEAQRRVRTDAYVDGR